MDLASYAYQIWKNAITADPTLQKTIPELPPVVYATRAHQPTAKEPAGVLVYLRTAEGNDALAWMDTTGNSVTESQFAILKAAECAPDTPALPRQENHHDLVQKAVELIVTEEKSVGGQLGRPSGAASAPTNGSNATPSKSKGPCSTSQELLKAIDDIYRYPLRPTAVDTLNRQLRSGISDEDLGRAGRCSARRGPAVPHPRRGANPRTAHHLLAGTKNSERQTCSQDVIGHADDSFQPDARSSSRVPVPAALRRGAGLVAARLTDSS